MTKTPYTPRPGSMPSLLMQHLQQHPAAAFTSAAISLKFGGNASAVQTALAPAVAAQLLCRARNGQPQRQHHYTAGPKLASFDLTPPPKALKAAKATPAPKATSVPAPTTDALRGYGVYCAQSDTVTLNASQREHLCLVIGAHVLAANAQLAAAEATPS